jgi:hypothetical protein
MKTHCCFTGTFQSLFFYWYSCYSFRSFPARPFKIIGWRYRMTTGRSLIECIRTFEYFCLLLHRRRCCRFLCFGTKFTRFDWYWGLILDIADQLLSPGPTWYIFLRIGCKDPLLMPLQSKAWYFY